MTTKRVRVNIGCLGCTVQIIAIIVFVAVVTHIPGIYRAVVKLIENLTK